MFSIFQQTYVHVCNLLVSFISLAYFSISTIKNKMPNCEKEIHKTIFSIQVTLHFIYVSIYLLPFQYCDGLWRKILRCCITDSASHGYVASSSEQFS